MSGRHSAPAAARQSSLSWPKLLAALVLVVVVVVGLGVFACSRLFGGCGALTPMRVAVDPLLAPTVAQVVADSDPDELGCAALEIVPTSSAAGAAAAVKPETAPALWIPDSSWWVAKASRSSGTLLDVAADSVAASPVVVVSRQGESPYFDTWLDVLRVKNIRLGDPLTDAVASAPVSAALAEVEQGRADREAVESALAPIAQAQAAGPPPADPDKRLADVGRDGGLAVASEQQLSAYRGANAGAELAGIAPQTGAFVLNYPVVATASGSAHDAARRTGVALAHRISTGGGAELLSDNGFRGPGAAPLRDGRGVGPVAALSVSDPGQLEAALKRYAVLALPSRALAVVDVSGSMNFPSGAGTRISLLVDAAEGGLRLFPDNAQVGLWAFSIGLGGGSQDWRELVPIRRMGERVSASTQRDALIAADRNLPSLVGGGTGLYDTVLAAWRKVKEGYDPKAVNSVIVATDGANDDPGSLSLAQLLEALRAEQDPARPVIVVTIGITEDADAQVLQQIASATGGTAYIARNPAEISNVYVNALKARQG